MVRAWYLPPESDMGPRDDPNMTSPPRFVSIDQVCRTTGISYHQVEGDDFSDSDTLQRAERELNYTAKDVFELTPSVPLEKLEMFYKEHLHPFPEIRLAEAGRGYFDLRDVQDQWIRIEIEKGDLLVLPPGIYHRFTPTSERYIKAHRYYVGHDEWVAHYRSEQTDQRPERVSFCDNLAKTYTT